jgi:hypothetical protein
MSVSEEDGEEDDDDAGQGSDDSAGLPGDSQADHCIVELHVSKTNQRGAQESIHIASPVAVRALWARRLRRHSAAEDAQYGEELFRRPGYKPARINPLLSFTRLALTELGYGWLHITGKCFRGGTSTLAALGAAESDADLRNLGRWRTAMWRTYVDDPAHKARALQSSRRM